MTKFLKIAATSALFLACTQVYSYNLPPGHFLLEGGWYRSDQGKAQDVAITGLVGDRFDVTNHHDSNSVFGVGYLWDAMTCERYGVGYGINVLYFAKTKVKGTITQEFLFTNLAYQYSISHLPIYAFAKGYYNVNDKFALTLDAGIGPNFMSVGQYSDSSLDGGVTLPDNAYTGNFSTTAFSGMVGVGVKFKVGCFPVEVGYRYFSLGEGYLNPRSDQILTQLKTGNNTAQALMVTVSV